jgi:hypothetical protein
MPNDLPNTTYSEEPVDGRLPGMIDESAGAFEETYIPEIAP